MDQPLLLTNISDFFPWLDLHTGSVSAVATIILVAITGYYAIQTRRTVDEMRAQRREAVRPFL